MVLQVVPKSTVAILGGGITGLTTAYYLKKHDKNANPVIFEKSPRVGGWVNTIQRGTTPENRFMYECGPRTIRPVGVSGMNTLDLLEEIGMDKQVTYITKDHPASKNRFIYVNNKLVKLPTDISILYKTREPFTKPLALAGLRDLFKIRQKMDDDSIYNFAKRRFGDDIANFAIDPLIRGVCAGNSKEISVKFLMKNLFEYEQKYGSVVLGHLMTKFKERGNTETVSEEEADIGFSKIALTSLSEGWSVWTLEKGLQSLADELEKILLDMNVVIHKNCNVKSLTFPKNDANVEIEFSSSEQKSNSTLKCAHVISTVPAQDIGNLVKPNYEELAQSLNTISSIDVQVTNLMFNDSVLPDEYDGFGFLVPSVEQTVPGLLGVVFDTCCFPQGDRTIFTVMSRPQNNMEKTIKGYLQSTLRIHRTPDDFNTQKLIKCIPQYTVGHYERVQSIRDIITKNSLPLTLIGASFDGVSVNDCIYGGKKAANNIFL